MNIRLFRLALLAVMTVGGSCFAILFTGEPARSQPPKPAAGGKARDSVVLQCLNCHGAEAKALERYSKEDWTVNGVKTGAKITDFVKLNESMTWAEHDMHSQAFARLDPKNEIAKRMQDNLAKMHADTPDYSITKDNRCLACHATDLNTKAPLAEKQFHTEYGVNCEACHGPGNQYIGTHFQPSWRSKSPADKEKEGLIDLRDPAKRTELCVSCHVGNITEGKFVTHEMYAAGHPPLPAFELVTFCRDQPSHYHQPRNDALEKLDPKAALERYHYRPMDSEVADARNLTIGTVGTMKAYADLVAEAAGKAGPNDILDFALFDCYACHHELKIPSYRQTRGYKGAPGRPTLPAWPGESTRVLLKSLDGVAGFTETKSKYDEASAALLKAIDARPFGIPADVAKAAKPLGESCRKLQADLANMTYDTAQAERLYTVWTEFVKNTPKEAAPGPDGLFLDYFAAQQTGWTIRVLQDGLRGRPGLKVTLPSADTADARQKKLGETVSLELRLSKTDNKQPSAKLFNDRMKQLGNFDLPPFLDAMNEFVRPGGK